LFFSGLRAATGYELWTSDGTVSGTFMVQDLVPGNVSSNPRYFDGAAGTVFFQAGGELWRVDQTAGPMNLPPNSLGNKGDAKDILGAPLPALETASPTAATRLPTARLANLTIVSFGLIDFSPVFVWTKPVDTGEIRGLHRSPSNFVGLLADQNEARPEVVSEINAGPDSGFAG
jgi:ELWxxDGT repeat protein